MNRTLPSHHSTIAGAPTVAYVMTDYPNPSHSFLRQEILGVQAEGVDVLPVSINPAAGHDLLGELDRAEHARTYAVKATPPRRVATVLLRRAVTSPLAFAAFLLWALRQGHGDLQRSRKRFLQALEGVLVQDECRRRGVRHLHAHFAGAPGFVARAAAEAARRFDGEAWTWSVTVHGPHDFMNERDAGLPDVVAEAAFVVAISDYTRAQLTRLAPEERRERIRLVRCGIDLDRFALRPERPVTGRVRLLNIGRLAPEKGQWVLLEALRRVVDGGLDAELHIIGNGPLRSALEQQIERLGLVERGTFRGTLSQEDVREAVAEADVFCMPSFAEGLPVSIMEAMAVGVPVVCTSIAGIPELVRDGETGRCVPAGSVDDFADAIVGLATDEELRHRLVVAGRARVEQLHDARHSAAALAALFAAGAVGSGAPEEAA